MADLPGLISVLQQQGIFAIYLPFLLTFTILFALLDKTKIFGKEARRINVLIAFIAALYMTILSPAAVPISEFFSNFFAMTSVFLVAVMVFVLIMGLFAGAFLEESEHRLTKVLVSVPTMVIALLIVGAMFFSSGGRDFFGDISIQIPDFNLNINTDDLILIGLVVFFLIVMIILVGGGDKMIGPLYTKK